MRVNHLAIAGVLQFWPRIYSDERGYFFETYQHDRYLSLGLKADFVQDNVSVSKKHVLRGLHFQSPHAQAKLVSVLLGSVWDVIVDLRPQSETYKQWLAVELSAKNGAQLYIPEGCAHGFLTLSEQAIFSYKCSEYYNPNAEHTLRWDDPELAITWPCSNPIISAKDRSGSFLADLEHTLLHSNLHEEATHAHLDHR